MEVLNGRVKSDFGVSRLPQIGIGLGRFRKIPNAFDTSLHSLPSMSALARIRPSAVRRIVSCGIYIDSDLAYQNVNSPSLLGLSKPRRIPHNFMSLLQTTRSLSQ